jgi:hypothetical protein
LTRRKNRRNCAKKVGSENAALRSLSKIDLPGALAPVIPLWAGEVITALICLAVIGVMRVAMDVLIPGAAPFVLIFPACLVATLVGGWRSGAGLLGIAASPPGPT